MTEWAAAAAQMVEDFQQDKDLEDEPPVVVLQGSWNSAIANRVFGQYRAPTEQPAWRDGLAGLLTPAQAETWRKEVPARAAALLKPFLKQAKEVQEDYRDSAGADLEKERTTLSNTYDLREGQEKKLQALATRLVNRRLTEWRTEAARCLADQPPEAVDDPPSDDLCVPDPRPVTAYDSAWIEGLGKILDAATWKALVRVLKERETRRPQVLAQMLVLLVDDEVRCTARQREQLRLLAERWVQAKPDLFQEQYREELKTAHFRAAASRATKAELAGVLDESQIRAWRRICVPGIVDEMGELVLRPPRDQAKAGPPAVPDSPDRHAESMVQAYMLRTEARIRMRCLARAVGCAQEIGRVCDLPEEARTLLQTAARGAVEASLREWRFGAETTVRDQIEAFAEENLATLQTQLDQLDGTGAMTEVPNPPEKQAIWTRALKNVMQGLPEEQAKAWQQEESARAEFKHDTIVRFALEDFNRVIYLTAEQMPKVQALLAQAVKTHAEELEQRDSGGESPAYLSTPQNLAPFNYIPGKSLRPLLTAAQWTGWTKSDAYVEPETK